MAVKQLKPRSDIEEQITEFKKEVLAMRSVESPYVIKLLGICFQPKLVMVMEYCSRGSLFDVMKKEETELDWNQVFEFLFMMVSGLKALHDHKPQLLHRDFKSLNLLVTEDWKIKLCDMGLARFNSRIDFDTLGKCCGSLCYAAPRITKFLFFVFYLKKILSRTILSIAICKWK